MSEPKTCEKCGKLFHQQTGPSGPLPAACCGGRLVIVPGLGVCGAIDLLPATSACNVEELQDGDFLRYDIAYHWDRTSPGGQPTMRRPWPSAFGFDSDRF